MSCLSFTIHDFPCQSKKQSERCHAKRGLRVFFIKSFAFLFFFGENLTSITDKISFLSKNGVFAVIFAVSVLSQYLHNSIMRCLLLLFIHKCRMYD